MAGNGSEGGVEWQIHSKDGEELIDKDVKIFNASS